MASDEWSQEDFISRMKDQFPKDAKDGDISALTNWMRLQDFNIFQREMLFNLVVMKHSFRTFPVPAKIRSWWENREGASKGDTNDTGLYGRLKSEIISKTGNYSPKKISKIYDNITSQYIGTDEVIPALRMMYVIFWEPLVTRFKICLEKGWMEELADSYCEPIRDKIVNGEPVGYKITGIDDRRTPEEIDMAKEKTMSMLNQIAKNLRVGKENSSKAEKREKSIQDDSERDRYS